MSTDSVNRAKFSRLPVWLYFVAGTFITYYAVMFYSELFEPRQVGIDCEFKDRSLVITGVNRSSPAGRAGIEAGDRLLTVDGSAIRTWEDWRLFVAHRELDRGYRFDLERAGQRIELQVKLGRQPGDQLARLERKRYVQIFLLLLALVLFVCRPGELVPRIGALFLAGLGTAPLFPGTEMTAVWRNLPLPLGMALWIPEITHLMLLPLFFTFFALLPRRLFRSPWLWIVVWAPAVILAGWWSPHIYDHVYDPPVLVELPAWFRFLIGLSILMYGGGALVAMLLNYIRLFEGERQRARVLLVGSWVGWLPGLFFLAAIFWGTLTESEVVWFFVSTKYRLFSLGCFLAFPVALAYALVRHRVFDLAVDPGYSVSLEPRSLADR